MPSDINNLVLAQSKACQIAAWPAHKADCRARQESRKTMDQTLADTLDSLRAFTNAHRQVIAECALRALGLWKDITIADREAFMVSVTRRPGAKRTRASWVVQGADVVACDTFSAKEVAGMKAQLHYMRGSAAAAGESETGPFCIMVKDVESKVCNVAVISFPPGEVRLYKASPQ